MNNLKPLCIMNINSSTFFDLLILYGTKEMKKELDRKFCEIANQILNPSQNLSVLCEKLFTIRQMQDLTEQMGKRGYF